MTTSRFVEWIDLAAELSRSTRGAFPRAAIASLLSESFECHVSWHWVEADGSFGFEWRGHIPGFRTPMWAGSGPVRAWPPIHSCDVGDRLQAVLLAAELGLLRERRAVGWADDLAAAGLRAHWVSPALCPDLGHWPVAAPRPVVRPAG